jgi:transcription elongation factor GreB
MSKAFTKEDEGREDEALAEERPVSSGSRYITRDGFKKLQDELSRLLKVDRPRVTAEVSAAAAQGDRSENAEYIYGKKKLREIDRRMRFLSKRLESLTVVERVKAEDGKVYFGAWVTVEDEDGEETTYRIVGPDEFEVALGRISCESPLAKALLGKREGDEVLVQRPKGQVELVIVSVTYSER